MHNKLMMVMSYVPSQGGVFLTKYGEGGAPDKI